MAFRLSLLLALPAFAALTAPALAGPCQDDLAKADAALSARLNAAAATGPAAPESTFATMHRQPTLGTVAGAEAQLGDLSPDAAAAANHDLEAAREADAHGNLAACEKALSDLRRQLAP